MSPRRSTAKLGMKRKNVFAPSGSKVDPWATFAATVPPVTLAWYQRSVAFPPLVALQFAFVALTPRSTVWSTQSDSAPPIFVYWACAIARIGRTSAKFAGVDALAGDSSGQQLGWSWVTGPVNVEVDGLSQTTWNLEIESAFRNCSVETKYSGDPSGGVPASRRALAGMTVKSEVSPAKSIT